MIKLKKNVIKEIYMKKSLFLSSILTILISNLVSATEIKLDEATCEKIRIHFAKRFQMMLEEANSMKWYEKIIFGLLLDQKDGLTKQVTIAKDFLGKTEGAQKQEIMQLFANDSFMSSAQEMINQIHEISQCENPLQCNNEAFLEWQLSLGQKFGLKESLAIAVLSEEILETIDQKVSPEEKKIADKRLEVKTIFRLFRKSRDDEQKELAKFPYPIK